MSILENLLILDWYSSTLDNIKWFKRFKSTVGILYPSIFILLLPRAAV